MKIYLKSLVLLLAMLFISMFLFGFDKEQWFHGFCYGTFFFVLTKIYSLENKTIK